MNIRNAGVTTKGWAVGEGEIKLTGNIPDQISLKPHKHVCLHIEDDTVRVIPCSFDKDRASGFFPHPDEQLMFSYEQGAKTKIKEIFFRRRRGQEVDENEPCVGSLELIEQLSMVPEENQKQSFHISDITVLSEVGEEYTKISVKGKVSYGRDINTLDENLDELNGSVSIVLNLHHSTNNLIFGNTYQGRSINITDDNLRKALTSNYPYVFRIENVFRRGPGIRAFSLGNASKQLLGNEWQKIYNHAPFYSLYYSTSEFLSVNPRAYERDKLTISENHLVFKCLPIDLFNQLLENGSKFQFSAANNENYPDGLGYHSEVTGYHALSVGGESRREITKLEMEGELNASGLSLKIFLHLSDLIPEQDGSIIGKPGLMDYSLSFLINWETLIVSGFNVYPYMDKHIKVPDGNSGAVSKALDQALEGLKRPFKFIN